MLLGSCDLQYELSLSRSEVWKSLVETKIYVINFPIYSFTMILRWNAWFKKKKEEKDSHETIKPSSKTRRA